MAALINDRSIKKEIFSLKKFILETQNSKHKFHIQISIKTTDIMNVSCKCPLQEVVNLKKGKLIHEPFHIKYR